MPVRRAKASASFREGATIDGRSIAAGPVLQVRMLWRHAGEPCQLLLFQGGGLALRSTPIRPPTRWCSATAISPTRTIRRRSITSRSTTPRPPPPPARCQLNYVLDSDFWAVCDQRRRRRRHRARTDAILARSRAAATAQATGGRGLVIENGYDFSNTFFGLDLEVSPTCLSMTISHDGQNTFISPYFNCTTAVNATAARATLLINPTLRRRRHQSRAAIDRGSRSSGTGNRVAWQFPSAASYTARRDRRRASAISSLQCARRRAGRRRCRQPATVTAGWTHGVCHRQRQRAHRHPRQAASASSPAARRCRR